MRRNEENMLSPVSAGAPRSYRRMYGPGPGHSAPLPHMDRYGRPASSGTPPSTSPQQMSANTNPNEEEGVEVVLERSGAKVVDSHSHPHSNDGRHHDQNVFRPPAHPHPSQHSRPMRSQRGSGHPPPSQYGGYPPPPPPSHRRGEFVHPHQHSHPHRPPPNQVPYTQSGSFDDNYPMPVQHYSPQVHYPTPARGYPPEDVNVISPNHKPDPYRPPMTPRSRQHAPPSQYYQYPPTSPVSRPQASQSNSPPRSKNYSRRGPRPEGPGPYSAAQREAGAYHPDDGTFNAFPAPVDHRPPLVAESSFDSDNYNSSHYSSHPPTPVVPPDSQAQFYGAGSWGSFDAAPTPPHFDDYRYYGYHPDSPYSHYPPGHGPGYYGDHHSQHHPYSSPYDDEGMREYHPDDPQIVTPGEKKHDDDGRGTKTANGSILPKAASEVDFEVTCPPLEPIMPPSDHPLCDSPAGINSHDVLCGRGGGTNSQIGNRRFRQLVQDFQPTYLLARRKEKPLLARTIVLIIRNRGGRFLKKDEETGELFEVGDLKAEAKTSQALREGLDVRATKSAASSLMDKKKKKKGGKDKEEGEGGKESTLETHEEEEPEQVESENNSPVSRHGTPPPRTESSDAAKTPPSSPPVLPRLQQGGDLKVGVVHPHSPEALQFRKRRRMRSGGCIPLEDKLFPDFCPPRAHLHRATSPFADDDDMEMATTPPHRNSSGSGSGYQGHHRHGSSQDHADPEPGCAGIAMSIMTGAATGSFCLGPSNWRRK